LNSIHGPAFSLALPFYNEEENIVPVVSQLTAALDRNRLDFELILVDNGSRDRTGELIGDLIASDARLKTAAVPRNLGYGWGVRQGLSAATGRWIGFMDGDAQIEPEDAARFLLSVDDNYDMIKVRRRKRQDGLIRARVSEIYIILFCLLFSLPIYDINAKPVIFKRELLEPLDLTSRDWFIDAELMLKADFLGLTIREIPVIFRRRQAGRSSVRPTTVVEFLKNITNYRFGKELKEWKKNNRLKS